MASSNLRRSSFPAPPSSAASDSSSSSAQPLEHGKRKKRKRDANVYDAVAGRVTTTHALDHGSDPVTFYQRQYRTSLRDSTLAPDEVLFQRLNAPIRYAEKDIYNAHQHLPEGGRGVLPDSDMLKAIHSYSSHFYAALARSGSQVETDDTNRQGSIDEHSMDETALLAFGILLEEAGREVLGKRGDLVFTEGEDVDTGPSGLGDGHAVGFLDLDPVGQYLKRGHGTRITSQANESIS
ncbi:membrane protein [Seiridium cupressi]